MYIVDTDDEATSVDSGEDSDKDFDAGYVNDNKCAFEE